MEADPDLRLAKLRGKIFSLRWDMNSIKGPALEAIYYSLGRSRCILGKVRDMKKWDVLRITTEGFVVEADNEEEARNIVANMGRTAPTIDIEVEEADPDEELFP